MIIRKRSIVSCRVVSILVSFVLSGLVVVVVERLTVRPVNESQESPFEGDPEGERKTENKAQN